MDLLPTGSWFQVEQQLKDGGSVQTQVGVDYAWDNMWKSWPSDGSGYVSFICRSNSHWICIYIYIYEYYIYIYIFIHVLYIDEYMYIYIYIHTHVYMYMSYLFVYMLPVCFCYVHKQGNIWEVMLCSIKDCELNEHKKLYLVENHCDLTNKHIIYTRCFASYIIKWVYPDTPIWGVS